ncbi:MAG: DUF4118 domain-containing protein, partial [Candidatus Manganitrophaceae bacterium]
MMERRLNPQFWHPAVQGLLGVVGVGLITFACFQVQTPYIFATAALLYLMVVVILSLNGKFIPSAFVSVVAVFCLQYFFLS